MTAGERLAALAGATGTAAALLLAIGTGATAGAALVDYSGLASATAAEHLLAGQAVVEPAAAASYFGGRKKLREEHDELTVEEVLQQWELHDIRRGAQAERAVTSARQEGASPAVRHAQPVPARVAAIEPAGEILLPMPETLRPAAIAAATVPSIDQLLPVLPHRQRMLADIGRRDDAAALVLLLSEL